MSARFRIQLISATTAAALAAAFTPFTPAALAAETSEFTISNVTDFHGYWEETKYVPGAARLKCAVDKAAEGKTHVFTSAGDNIGASPFASKLLNDAPTLEILNLMNLQVSALGNHELDEGAEDFSNRVTAAAKFDYLAANAKTVKNTKDYVVKDLDGAKVAFVGTITDDMPNLVNPKSIEGIAWNDPVATTNELAEELKSSGEADVVIALVHEGGIKADEFSDAVDVAFLGHSHQAIEPSGEKPLLIQAGSNGTNLANVDLSFDRAAKKLTVQNAELLDADMIRACDTPQPEIDAVIKDALDKAGTEGKKVIGRADAHLYRAGDKESQLNNYIAEATRQGVTKNSSVTADIGVMNAGGVRAEIEAGDVTYEQAFSVQPFGGENTYVELKGSDVVQALEEQWRDDPDRPMFPLGISDNVSYTYDPAAPVGSKVTSSPSTAPRSTRRRPTWWPARPSCSPAATTSRPSPRVPSPRTSATWTSTRWLRRSAEASSSAPASPTWASTSPPRSPRARRQPSSSAPSSSTRASAPPPPPHRLATPPVPPPSPPTTAT